MSSEQEGFQVAVVTSFWRHGGPRFLPTPVRAAIGLLYGEQKIISREGPALTAEQAQAQLDKINQTPNKEGYIVPFGELGNDVVTAIAKSLSTPGVD